MKTGTLGRADLLDAYLAGGPELQSVVARLLGMELVIPEPIAVPPEVRVAAVSTAAPSPPAAPVISIPFWRAATIRIEPPRREGETEPVEIPAADKPTVDQARPAPLVFRPLATDAVVLTKLRRVSSFSRISGEIDVAKAIDHLSRGRYPSSLPRRLRKTWGQSIHVIVDEHKHLKPYSQDQHAVLETLRRVYPSGGVDVVTLRDWASQPHRHGAPRSATCQPLKPGATILALSDLGALALERSAPRETWLQLGKFYRDRGARPIALVPCDVSCVPLELTRDWIVIPWESRAASRAAGLSPEQVEQVSQRVLTLLSYALRVEPILIREVRRLLVKGSLGAGVEARVWQDPALRGQDYDAAEFHPSRSHQLQRHFENEPADVRREVVSLLRRGHIGDYELVWFLERLALEAETTKLQLTDVDLDAAVRWVRSQQQVFGGAPEKRDPTSDESLWFRRAFIRLPESSLNGSAGESLHQIWALTRSTRDHPPTGLDPARVPPPPGRSVRTVEIRHAGDCLFAWPFEGGPGATRPSGSLLAQIRTRTGLIKVEPFDDFWEGGVAPPWADDWGRDDFGPWVQVRVERATQRLRWIPPGTFWMGSPEDEKGRFEDEGPRHEKTIAQGFWMFDTPCTQAFWEAVMGKNPSRFEGKDRPVENVSWEDCQGFISQLKEKCQGLELSLPTEAQWEYACRAGTVTARYRENLDDIAWYLENSDGGTHPVGQKAANDRGLYDTLGNVFEWCADIWTDDYSEKSRVASAARVIRGGSWSVVARFVRAASRDGYGPADRYDYVGFRCAEFKSCREPSIKSGQQVEAERARERIGGSGADGERDQASGADWINLDSTGKSSLVFGAVTPRRIASDVEQIVLDTVTLPEWASAIGRDKYGLWAEFTIDRSVEKQAPPQRPPSRLGKLLGRQSPAPPSAPSLRSAPIRQRLRWIPPGRFMMGSPKDEEGRADWEQPPHEVVINEGFWIFATPCTQALWEAHMGGNPSLFQSPDRPVEQVSWVDCDSFAKKLSERIGLALALPSEAQWEFACRAGTTTSTYAGPLEIKGANNAPILDAIAWYGGNSGHEFNLANGEDASAWPEKQYPFDKAGTCPVAKKRANSWGLYDMLGNVFEWCADKWVHGGRGETSADRVIRGGSWLNDARSVRAAYRGYYEPAYRNNDVGCRFAEFRRGVVSSASRAE
jgi:formylglycine-generating enzyme required for sulfatase activity